MKICFVGQLKPKFILSIDTKNNLVIDVKEQILEKLGLKKINESIANG